MGPIEASLKARAHEIHERLKNTKLPDDIQAIDYVSKIRELEKKIKVLEAQLLQARFETAKPSIQGQVIHRIIAMVSEKERIAIADLTGPCRLKMVCLPRQICMYLASHYTNCSSVTIGKQLGGRDHSVIFHSRDKIAKKRLVNQAFHIKMCWYEEQLGHGPIV